MLPFFFFFYLVLFCWLIGPFHLKTPQTITRFVPIISGLKQAFFSMPLAQNESSHFKFTKGKWINTKLRVSVLSIHINYIKLYNVKSLLCMTCPFKSYNSSHFSSAYILHYCSVTPEVQKTVYYLFCTSVERDYGVSS